MAKLYAELTSDKGGRIVGKGGNDYIDVTIADNKGASRTIRAELRQATPDIILIELYENGDILES